MNDYSGWQEVTPACADVRVLDAKEGRVVCTPPRKRVAIVGAASSSQALAPWTDPTYELWGLNQCYRHFQRRPDRWFEIHLGAEREDAEFPNYFTVLRTMGVPLYMVDVEPALPTSVRYPLDRVRAGAPAHMQRYFTSSVSYMTALALHEGFETIAFYGVDLTIGTEYELQKACLEAWSSYAAGRGVEILIPPTSALFRAPYMYGYEQARTWAPVLRANKRFIDGRIEELKRQYNEAQVTLQKIDGAISELEFLWTFAESSGRGAQFPHMLEDK